MRKVLLVLCAGIVAAGFLAMAYGLIALFPPAQRSLVGLSAFVLFAGLASLVSFGLELKRSNAELAREMARLKREIDDLRKAAASPMIR